MTNAERNSGGRPLRELADATLQAYRNLNEAAAEARFGRNGHPSADRVHRAAELLQEVLEEIGVRAPSSG